MKSDIYLSVRYASKKVNLCYKPLAVQISVRTTDEQGKYSFEHVGWKQAENLIAQGKVDIHTGSETKECLSKASNALLGCVNFGRRVELRKTMKKLEHDKGEALNWFEKLGLFVKESAVTWPKSGIKI